MTTLQRSRLETLLSSPNDILGPKARNLQLSGFAGVAIPDSWVMPPQLINASLENHLPDMDQDALFVDHATYRSLHKECSDLVRRYSPGTRFAVRTSHNNEDGEVESMAGQYRTELNHLYAGSIATAILRCWRDGMDVSALPGGHTTPTILIQKLVPSSRSGVLFHFEKTTLIAATWGLASSVVDGSSGVEFWEVSEGVEPECVLSEKDTALVPAYGRTNPKVGELVPCPDLPGHPLLECESFEQEGACARVKLNVDLVDQNCLSRKDVISVLRLANQASNACNLENYDMEWAISADGEPVLLQIRPLTALPTLQNSLSTNSNDSGQGLGIVNGIAVGRAEFVRTEAEAKAFPSGAILVTTRLAGPTLSAARRASGCIVESRSPLSHSAIIARELGIPCIGAVNLSTIEPGRNYSIDGTTGSYRRVDQAFPIPSTERSISTEGHLSSEFEAVFAIAAGNFLVDSPRLADWE